MTPPSLLDLVPPLTVVQSVPGAFRSTVTLPSPSTVNARSRPSPLSVVSVARIGSAVMWVTSSATAPIVIA